MNRPNWVACCRRRASTLGRPRMINFCKKNDVKDLYENVQYQRKKSGHVMAQKRKSTFTYEYSVVSRK